MNFSPYALEELLIWQASDLARRGHYSDAEAILLCFESSEGPHSSTAYRLLSSIFVKQRKYAEAKGLLQKAVALDPKNVELRDALEGLPYIQRKSQVIRLISIVAPLLLIAVGASTFFLISSFSSRPEPIPANSQYSSLPTGTNAKKPVLKPETSVNWPDISITGVSVAKNSSEMRITFDKGLFPEACHISPEGRPLLKAVTESLAGSGGALLVIIEGHSDDLAVRAESPFRDNMNLGLMRAQTILNLFKNEYRYPESGLLAVSKGEEEPPYSNEIKTRNKNRTVTLRVLAIRRAE